MFHTPFGIVIGIASKPGTASRYCFVRYPHMHGVFQAYDSFFLYFNPPLKLVFIAVSSFIDLPLHATKLSIVHTPEKMLLDIVLTSVT